MKIQEKKKTAGLDRFPRREEEILRGIKEAKSYPRMITFCDAAYERRKIT